MSYIDFDEETYLAQPVWIRRIAHTSLGHYLVTKEPRWLFAFLFSLAGFVSVILLFVTIVTNDQNLFTVGANTSEVVGSLKTHIIAMTAFFMASNFASRRWAMVFRYGLMLAFFTAVSLILF